MLELLLKKAEILKRNLKFLIIFEIAFIVGIILGIVLFFKDGKNLFYDSVFLYFYNVFSLSVNPFSVLFKRIFIDLGFSIVFFLLGFTVYTFPVQFVFVFYRGIVIGCVSCIFFNVYSFYGLTLFILVTFPQNIIMITGLAIGGVLNFNYQINKHCDSTDVKEIICNTLLGFAVCIIGAIYEFLILVLIIRPLNFYL